jgi:hypothetical protein
MARSVTAFLTNPRAFLHRRRQNIGREIFITC